MKKLSIIVIVLFILLLSGCSLGKQPEPVPEYVGRKGEYDWTIHKTNCNYVNLDAEESEDIEKFYTSYEEIPDWYVPCPDCMYEAYCEYARKIRIKEDAEWFEYKLDETEEALLLSAYTIEVSADRLGLTFEELFKQCSVKDLKTLSDTEEEKEKYDYYIDLLKGNEQKDSASVTIGTYESRRRISLPYPTQYDTGY